MSDYKKKMKAHQGKVSDEEQILAGRALTGSMEEKHNQFIKDVIRLIDSGEINLMNPRSFLKIDVYEKLDEEWRDKTDLALINIANQLSNIIEFFKSKKTPDESPHLQTMIEQLWIMKQRIEEHYDVFKF